jgi:AcrR family transcriptional regulator
MALNAPGQVRTKQRLTVDRVLDGAMALADEIGVHALTIRRLADALDTKPMTIYHHLSSKEAILDGMVDRVFAQIDHPPADLGWKAAMRHRCMSAREVLNRHPWAAPLMEARANPGPETLGHHDAVLGCLRAGGLSLEMTAHVYSLLDSYVYGFALTEVSMPATGGTDMADLAGGLIDPLPDGAFPHLSEFAAGHVMQPGYDYRTEFEYGLDLILDALEHRVRRSDPAPETAAP